MAGRSGSSPAWPSAVDAANEVLVSSASEVATRHRLGRLPHGDNVVASFARAIGELRADELPITVEHALMAGGLDVAHRDPFDRMLAAQAMLERAVLLTSDASFAGFPVETHW